MMIRTISMAVVLMALGCPTQPPSDNDGDDTEYLGFIGGAGSVLEGAFTDGRGELAVTASTQDDETEVCIVTWTNTQVEVVTGCEDCDFAFVVEASDPEVEVDEDDQCAEWGGIPGEIDERQESVGVRDGVVLTFNGSVWWEVDDGFYDPAQGEFEWYMQLDEP